MPIWVRAIGAEAMLPKTTGCTPARAAAGLAERDDATAKGRSSKVFQAAHCGQRPSQRVDSNPHPEQKKTLRALAIDRLFEKEEAAPHARGGFRCSSSSAVLASLPQSSPGGMRDNKRCGSAFGAVEDRLRLHSEHLGDRVERTEPDIDFAGLDLLVMPDRPDIQIKTKPPLINEGRLSL
jgi:hypothetical protein